MVFKVKIEEERKNIFDILELLGDFLIFNKHEFIIKSDMSKTKIKNRINKSTKNGCCDIMILSKEYINDYPDVVKSWILEEDMKKQIKNISLEEIQNKALKELNCFIEEFENKLVEK